MRVDKKAVYKLRMSGKTYEEISSIQGVSKSTLSRWFGKDDWSERVKIANVSEANAGRMQKLNRVRRANLNRIFLRAKAEALLEFSGRKLDPLFVAGMMLYLSGGDKVTKGQVRLSSSDGEVVSLYCKFMLDSLGVVLKRVRASVTLYADMDEGEKMKWWITNSGIPATCFTKSATIAKNSPKVRAQNGICTIVISSTYLKIKMMEWLRLLPRELKKR